MRQGASVVWHHSLLLMNSFNKTEAAVFSCRLCFLRAFPFISFLTLHGLSYQLKRCLKKECCKQCRHAKFKGTITKWPVHRQTHRTDIQIFLIKKTVRKQILFLTGIYMYSVNSVYGEETDWRKTRANTQHTLSLYTINKLVMHYSNLFQVQLILLLRFWEENAICRFRFCHM